MKPQDHPLWAEYRKWDKTIHCGIPDINDDNDRTEFNAFVTGYDLHKNNKQTKMTDNQMIEKMTI